MTNTVNQPKTLTIDIGGTGIKTLVLDAEGVAITPRQRELTPQPAAPAAVLALIERMLKDLPAYDRVAVGFPGVVLDGICKTAPNLGPDLWRGVPLEKELAALLGRPVRVINDADLQGYGVIEGSGVELVLTLGTGLGTALFVDGRLVPNLELGHHPFRKGQTYEESVSDAELEQIGKSRWSRRVLLALEQLGPIFNYRLVHVGGGNAQKFKEVWPENVRLFQNATALRGGVRLWELESLEPALVR